MLVYFLRHGLAGDRDTWTGRDDERPLTEEGRERLLAQGKRLAKIGLRVDSIVTSPLVRARETAEIVAGALEFDGRIAKDARLGEGFDAAAFSAIVHEYGQASSLMLVGHEPTMSEVLGEVTGARLDLKKGALACVELSDEKQTRGVLTMLVPPRVLAPK
jgi:phosphohistidine phosphatase